MISSLFYSGLCLVCKLRSDEVTYVPLATPEAEVILKISGSGCGLSFVKSAPNLLKTANVKSFLKMSSFTHEWEWLPKFCDENVPSKKNDSDIWRQRFSLHITLVLFFILSTRISKAKVVQG